jgi:hypothetical protein
MQALLVSGVGALILSGGHEQHLIQNLFAQWGLTPAVDQIHFFGNLVVFHDGAICHTAYWVKCCPAAIIVPSRVILVS